MASHVEVYLRKTFRYVGTFKDMDEHVYLGQAKLLARRRLPQPDSYYEEISHGPVYTQRVIIPKGANRKLWQEALTHEFSRHGCHHEYDCCGCASHTADVKFVSKREAVLHISVSYNC